MKPLLPKLLFAVAVAALVLMALARGDEPKTNDPSAFVEITKDPPTNAHAPETPIEWPKQNGSTNPVPAEMWNKRQLPESTNSNEYLELVKSVESLKAEIAALRVRSETNVLYKVTFAVQLQTPDGLIYAISSHDLSNLVQLGVPARWVPELIIHKQQPR